MAVDWKKLAKEAILADGRVDENEAKILKKELFSGGAIAGEEELEFLLELRDTATKKAKAKGEALTDAFNKLVTAAVAGTVLEEGKVSAEKVQWLKEKLPGLKGKKIDPKKLDAGTKEILTHLHKKVKDKGPELTQLLQDTETMSKPEPKEEGAAAPAKKPAAAAAAAPAGGGGEEDEGDED